MTVIDYDLLSALSARSSDAERELIHEVRAAIAAGWEPQGGVCTAVVKDDQYPSPLYFCQQAMVKRS